MPRFSSIFLPFLVKQIHKHKLIFRKNTNTKTNPATDLSCQPNNKRKPKHQQEYKPRNPSSANPNANTANKHKPKYDPTHPSYLARAFNL